MKVDVFAPVDVCGATATAAFAALGDVDAVIFDLRGNGGGTPEMVTYVESYLFAKRASLLRPLHARRQQDDAVWTNPDVPGRSSRHNRCTC